MGPDDMTAPGIFYQHDVDFGEEITPFAPQPAHGGAPRCAIVVALAASLVGIVWTIISVIMGIEDMIASSFTADLIGHVNY